MSPIKVLYGLFMMPMDLFQSLGRVRVNLDPIVLFNERCDVAQGSNLVPQNVFKNSWSPGNVHFACREVVSVHICTVHMSSWIVQKGRCQICMGNAFR